MEPRPSPADDAEFAKYVAQPELAKLLPVLYPGVFPNLAALHRRPRRPAGDPADRHPRRASFPGFQNYTGPTQADMLRLNVAIPPAASPNINGILGGDLAGFPNGRRVFDDVVTIELRAVAGATIPAGRPDLHARRRRRPRHRREHLEPGQLPANFPYLDHPVSGYDVQPLSA